MHPVNNKWTLTDERIQFLLNILMLIILQWSCQPSQRVTVPRVSMVVRVATVAMDHIPVPATVQCIRESTVRQVSTLHSAAFPHSN
jgi:hypothetical protein